jgi:hypothetical protein
MRGSQSCDYAEWNVMGCYFHITVTQNVLPWLYISTFYLVVIWQHINFCCYYNISGNSADGEGKKKGITETEKEREGNTVIHI